MPKDDSAPLDPAISIDPVTGRREMLIDGAPSSVYEPDSPMTGDVWDALACPIQLLAEIASPRVLLLGLGGATVARLVRTVAPNAYIAAIEISPNVIEAAREHFDLDALMVDVTRADAQSYLRDEASERFDLIVEDIFLGRDKHVRKPSWLPSPGYDDAKRWLHPNGIFVANTVNESPGARMMLQHLYKRVVAMRVEFAHNTVFAASDREFSAESLSDALASVDAWARLRPRLSILDLE